MQFAIHIKQVPTAPWLHTWSHNHHCISLEQTCSSQTLILMYYRCEVQFSDTHDWRSLISVKQLRIACHKCVVISSISVYNLLPNLETVLDAYFVSPLDGALGLAGVYASVLTRLI